MIRKTLKEKKCDCGYYGKFRGKKCGVCQQKKWNAARIKNRKPTGQKDVFLEVWNESGGKSFVDGQSIIYPCASNFSHVLAKGKAKYYKFKLYKKNIVLMTEEQHHIWEYKKKSIENDPKWKHVFELEAELKNEYKQLYGI